VKKTIVKNSKNKSFKVKSIHSFIFPISEKIRIFPQQRQQQFFCPIEERTSK